MNEYLTEKSLGSFLNYTFKNGLWIHDKQFIRKTRPDYRNDYYKMIVEFDGYNHYTSAKRILSDIKKDKMYSDNGYQIIRIPYFVQLSKDVIFNLFKCKVDYTQSYKHGFIDKKCILPCDFCYLGIEKFKNDLIRFHYIKEEIIDSLIKRCENSDDILSVIPYHSFCDDI